MFQIFKIVIKLPFLFVYFPLVSSDAFQIFTDKNKGHSWIIWFMVHLDAYIKQPIALVNNMHLNNT